MKQAYQAAFDKTHIHTSYICICKALFILDLHSEHKVKQFNY